MKALSLWQPWASLIMSEVKIHETRSWQTSYCGPMYIHAAKRPIGELSVELEQLCFELWGDEFRKKLPLGQVIGIVNLVSCTLTEKVVPYTTGADKVCGDFTPGRYAWRCEQPCPIGPWPWRGRQGLFEISQEALEAVANAALGICP